MEAINTKAIKTKVAEDNNYACWDDILYGHQNRNVSNTELKRLENEVISEVAKQVAEATKQSCADSAETKIEEVYVGDMDSSGSLYRKVASIDVNSILNAPIPEIK